MRREKGAESGSRRAILAFPPVAMDRAYDVIDVLVRLASAKGKSVAQLAVGWLLQQKGVASVLLGATRVEQLDDTLGAVDVTFTADELAALNAASELPAEYPGWMVGMWSAERAQQLAGSRI